MNPNLMIRKEIRKQWHILALEGPFVVSSLRAVRIELERAEREGLSAIAVDLAGVDNIDSSAIGLLMNFGKRFAAAKGRFCVLSPKGDVAEILEMVSFGKKVTVYSSRAEWAKAVEG
jgi:anti-anti-sigma factor